jgi:hypothetical protein
MRLAKSERETNLPPYAHGGSLHDLYGMEFTDRSLSLIMPILEELVAQSFTLGISQATPKQREWPREIPLGQNARRANFRSGGNIT